ncbi:MAG: DUF711 family protein [Comamonas sp.]
MNISFNPLVRVRTVTAFVNMPTERAQWQASLSQAKQQCDAVADAIEAQGYRVQSIRIVSNPFGEFINVSGLDSALADLQHITQLLTAINTGARRIRFAIGEARNAQEVALLPQLIAAYGDLCNACVNIDLDEHGFLQTELLAHSVQAIQKIARTTPRGEGNFNFTVNFNCAPGIPYFPASYHRGQHHGALVLGLETPDLMVADLAALQAQRQQLDHAAWFKLAFERLSQSLTEHATAIQRCADGVTLAHGWRIAGMDTSAAPSKSCASMVDVYQLLGVPYFGASGTVEASALLTRVFKSVQGVTPIGFSGLMLAVTEDQGLAQASLNNAFDIRALLTYSSVCGIGLDTVPVPGDSSNEQIAAVMRDTGTMAFRLNKPLTVRLFPVPGLKAGDRTAFESDDLCNCAVLALP